MPALTATALPEGIVAACKGGRAIVVHAWKDGTKWWTSLCAQEQVAIGSHAFCRQDSLDVKGKVGCDLCRAALRGEVNPHAKAHELPPAAEKKQLAKLDAVDTDKPAPAGACVYQADKDVPGVCSRCGMQQEDHDVRKVPGANAALQDAGACATCGLELRRVGDQVQHLQANGVLATKGRGGCKKPKLPDPVATTAVQLQARVDAGEKVTAKDAAAAFAAAEPAGRTQGYKARPAAFDPPAPPAATPKSPPAGAEPAHDGHGDGIASTRPGAADGLARGDEGSWVGTTGCSPRCEVLHRGRPHAKGDEQQLAAAFAATAPDVPMHLQPGACSHGTPLRAECPRCDPKAVTAPIGSRDWMKQTALHGLAIMRAELERDDFHQANKTAVVLGFITDHAQQRTK